MTAQYNTNIGRRKLGGFDSSWPISFSASFFTSDSAIVNTVNINKNSIIDHLGGTFILLVELFHYCE